MTKAKWIVHETDGGAIYISDNHNFSKATFFIRMDGERERAELIVRAVNAHDALVKMVNKIVPALDRLTTDAASVDNLLHADFKVADISTEQSRLYNSINHAKGVLFEAAKLAGRG